MAWKREMSSIGVLVAGDGAASRQHFALELRAHNAHAPASHGQLEPLNGADDVASGRLGLQELKAVPGRMMPFFMAWSPTAAPWWRRQGHQQCCWFPRELLQTLETSSMEAVLQPLRSGPSMTCERTSSSRP